jgi:hypothetical protein
MDLKAVLRGYVNPGGFCVAATYILIFIFVFVFTAATTKPGNVGLDWIPFVLVCMPWYGFTHSVLAAFVANLAVMYFLGTLLQTFWSRIIKP